ncbi:MAG: HPr kinase/phosphorylase [Myxococcaceae bacterium]|nr:HPr kinase/phosphorylase [Myxococcaceae bacterium]
MRDSASDSDRPSGIPEIAVAVRTVLEHPELRDKLVLHAGAAGVERLIAHPRVQKSGLVLVGHTQGIVPTRVQVLGETEVSYLESLAPETRAERVRFLCSMSLSLIVVTRGVVPLPELVEQAELSGTPLVSSPTRSSTTINRLHTVLDRLLAPRARLHGVLVEMYGVGTLLIGPSGIGKSECALFLVERGHRLVADDLVELTRLPNATVLGSPAPLLRHHLEIRGVGILNIRDLFGATSVRDEAHLDLVVELCPWREDEVYERLGLDDQTMELLGTKISRLRIPVRPGRDMGVLLEMAARNHLLKREGVHGAKRFAERLERELTNKKS